MWNKHKQQRTNKNIGEERKQQSQTVVVVKPSVGASKKGKKGLYTGYFERIEDTNDYQEDMEPWLRDPNAAQNYLFRCMTINKDDETIVTAAGCCKGKSEAKDSEKEQTSVYHKVNSKRLIIKKKEQISSVAQMKKNPCALFALLLIFISIILLIAAIASGGPGALYGVAIVMLLIGIAICFFGKRGATQMHTFIMISQSIPINSIFYVDRQVEQQSQLKGRSCGSCCSKQEEEKINYSTISIGYNRSNLSDKFNASASTKDFITVTLVSNQAYNLHQYLNCIIDGTHPYFNNINIGYSYTDDNQLSRF
mmetsp:Transcript_41216/g.36398  ORF Transcript_41216/g.36398 Transcript_41216/m.36398 type:complete len:309 (-) Transcript_41216:117-1043(-)